ncbi:hypothetical protein QTP81_13745 [Alteromonas sp. ASW11-36]|uniref:STAS/SEC14 domain-containing protein n=1 Tax=Alteromonas arenosi TaxID=3055817 RepID=A0ABT7T1I0_9ALTE|nr:hypothetical protein [Alteromonas sp. ASW11-36]MDM7861659.1 hypothetical protein [Alteromonas sp. ASW11-36]
MSTSKFIAHGEYTLDVESHLLIIHAYNGWNVERSLAFKVNFEQMILRHFDGQPFAALVCTHDWLPTPDSIPVLQSMTSFALQQGMFAQAYCFSSSLEADVILKKVSPQPAPNFKRECFFNEQEARDWLASLEVTRPRLATGS